MRGYSNYVLDFIATSIHNKYTFSHITQFSYLEALTLEKSIPASEGDGTDPMAVAKAEANCCCVMLPPALC